MEPPVQAVRHNLSHSETMKFMTIVRGPENMGPPPAGLIEGIMRLGDEAAKAGVFVTMGGLMPSAASSKIRISEHRMTITDGPFTEAKEIVGGFAVYDVQSKGEAMAWARRFMELHLEHWPEWEGETEIRPLMEGPPPGAGGAQSTFTRSDQHPGLP